MEPIAITGIGMITPWGYANAVTTQKMLAGESCLAPWFLPEFSELGPVMAGRILFDLREALGGPGWRNHTRNALMGCLASRIALAEAQIRVPETLAAEEIGVVQSVINNYFDDIFIELARREDYRLINPQFFINFSNNSLASQLSILHQFKGLGISLIGGFTAGIEVLELSAQLLRAQRARMIMAGCGEEMQPHLVKSFARSYAEQDAKHPGVLQAGRPNQVWAGEGCAQFVLEPARQAIIRGARIRALLAGFGFIQQPGASAEASCRVEAAIRQALQQAQLEPAAVDAVFVAANGNRIQDEAEAKALEKVFRSHRPPGVALKGALGETFQANGALATVAAILSAESGQLPATLRLLPGVLAEQLNLSSQPQKVQARHILVMTMDQAEKIACLLLSFPAEAKATHEV